MSHFGAYTIAETLDDRKRASAYRAVRDSDGRRVMLKVADPHRCRPADIARLKHEHTVGSQLRGEGVLQVLALDSCEGMLALVMEDFGGQPLDHLLGSPFGVERFLALAVRIASAVAHIHRQGIVHKNLTPEAIFVCDATGEVRIGDFGIASRAPREQPAADPTTLVEGSLPYLSPEQTGRINRALDSRTDLYSIGIVFFQMLTGKLPFEAHDPLEWLHCHVARPSPSPSQLVPEVPAAIAQIVLRLLEKMPDDRYQTARGLQHDLSRCLSEWQASGRIEPFPLGARDIADRILVPQKLYGRDRQKATLLSAFQRVLATGRREVVLCSGAPGVGKSSLVHELEKNLFRERGFFTTGKFDAYTQDIPYSALAQALTHLVLDILAGEDETISRWKQALTRALGSHCALITDVIPSLKLLLGEQPPIPELPPTEAEARFRRAFQILVRVFSTREHPFVLFLDDLQWADSASLKLIEDMVGDHDAGHLLLIGSFRESEVSPSHPLIRTLQKLRESSVVVTDVVLSPLTIEDVVDLVGDTVHTDRERAHELAVLVHDKTGGNPFFAIQFIEALYREGLLELNQDTLTWQWDIGRIREKGYTDNVIDFMVQQLGALAATAQRALEVAACMGSRVDAGHLAELQGTSEEQLQNDLAEPLAKGLVVRSQNEYVFAHDRVRQAAHSLVAEERRPELHLRIGRLLLGRIQGNQLEQQVFDIVSHLNLAASLLTLPEERTQLTELNLLAARRAKAGAAYGAAVGFLRVAATMLGQDPWEDQYERTYTLFREYAECAFLSGASDEALRLVRLVLQSARSRMDKAGAYRVLLDLQFGSRDTWTQAISSALECLHLFGIDLPLHPSWEEVVGEYDEVWKTLSDRKIEDLIDLPAMADPEMDTAMQIIKRLYALTFDRNLYCLQYCRAVNICLRYGHSPSAATVYGTFGLILGSVFHRKDEGHRFAKLGYDLMQRQAVPLDRGRVCYAMQISSFWNSSLDESLAHSRGAFEAATEAGDVVTASFVSIERLGHMILRGDPLTDVQRESGRTVAYVRRLFPDAAVPIQRFVRMLQGETRCFGSLDGDDFSEAHFEADEHPSTTALRYWVIKLMARFISGDYRGALAAADKSAGLLWAASFTWLLYCFHFYRALTLAAAHGELTPEKRGEALELISVHQAQLQEWAANPTFQHACALVSAELARLRGHHELAMRLYENAIQSARRGNFVQDEATALELASRFYRGREYTMIADLYVREARACYLRWGAHGKVKDLERLYPELREHSAVAPPTATFTANAEQLELLSVVKASQAISQEIVLDKLLGRLVEVVMQQAGAQRAFVCLQRHGKLTIEAEAHLASKGAVEKELLHSAPAESSAVLPAAIVHFVLRTKEKVIVEDATASPMFSSDEYIARTRPKSVLCLPILKQAVLVGILYMENNLVTGAFTADRLEVVELLASQAAISLENALLLSQEQTARVAAQEAARRSSFLAAAGVLLGESLDHEQVIRQLASLVVRDFGEWCVIDVVQDGQIRRVGGAHSDPAREALLRELGLRYPPRWGSEHPASRVIRTGEPILWSEVTEDSFHEFCEDDHHARLIRALGSRTGIVVPLIARGLVLGAISLASGSSTRRFGKGDLQFMQELAMRAAMAIDNGRLYAQAQEAVRLRDEFLSVASHELNTPLMSLMLALECLADAGAGHALDSQSTAKLAQVAEQQGHRLTRLIRELLDVTRIQAGRLSLHVEDVDLGGLVREVVARFERDLAQAGSSASVQVVGRVVGRWDRSRLEQVLSNLLSNAVKFGAGKPIEILVEESAGIARFAIRDHGIGIEPDQQKRLFERFERGVSAKHYGGLGLGLYICRRILEAHHGSIHVQSQPDIGATFTIEIPCARAPAPPQPAG